MTRKILESFLRAYAEGTEPAPIDRRGERLFELSDDEIIEYSKSQGYFGLKPSDAKKEDFSFYREVRRRNLVDVIFKRAKREQGALKEWDLVHKELQGVIQQIGHFPSQRELQMLGKSSIASAVRKYHNGVHAVRERMGYGNDSKEPNYWKDFVNVQRELQEVVEQLGHFPTLEEFRGINRTDLSSAIQKNHGGLDAVRARLGFAYLQKPKKYWKDWGNLERELQEVIEQLGHFPSKTELEGIGRNDVSLGIVKYHGGMNKVRKKMGYELLKRPDGELSDPDLIKREITLIMENHTELNGKFPSDHWLRNNGYISISKALSKDHGGINVIRGEMGFVAPTRQPNYLKSWENISFELGKASETLGHFPTQRELIDLGESSVAYAISKYHGGMSVVRQRFESGRVTSSKKLESLLEAYAGDREDG